MNEIDEAWGAVMWLSPLGLLFVVCALLVVLAVVVCWNEVAVWRRRRGSEPGLHVRAFRSYEPRWVDVTEQVVDRDTVTFDWDWPAA